MRQGGTICTPQRPPDELERKTLEPAQPAGRRQPRGKNVPLRYHGKKTELFSQHPEDEMPPVPEG